MRLRRDNHWDAGLKRVILLGAVPDLRKDPKHNYDPEFLRFLNDDSFEAAQEGDVWEVRGHPTDHGTVSWQREGHEDWPLIGYGLVCPNERCVHGVHMWDHASYCTYRATGVCSHPKPEGQVQSCWTWAGSVTHGTLTAHPSLFINDSSCGWHGWLRDGRMEGSVEPQFQALSQ